MSNDEEESTRNSRPYAEAVSSDILFQHLKVYYRTNVSCDVEEADMQDCAESFVDNPRSLAETLKDNFDNVRFRVPGFHLNSDSDDDFESAVPRNGASTSVSASESLRRHELCPPS